jgi:pimeloyl-ACP methyl ester carboxylesterase
MILPALLLPLLCAQAPASAPAPPKQVWSADDRTKVVDLLRKLDEARQKEKGEKEAKESLGKALDAIGKKYKADPLSFVGDLQKVLESVPKYESNASSPAIGKEALCKPDPKSKFQFVLRLPKGYDAKRPWPLLLVIPPAGEKPDAYLRSAWKDESLHATTILAAPEMPAKVAEWRQLEGGVAAAMNTFREVLDEFNLDRDRVVVAGGKEGGAFAVTLASYFPDRFAGAVSRLGGGEGAAFANLGNVPTYLTGGSDVTKKASDAAKELRRENVTIIEADDLAAVAKWIAERTRDPVPTEVAFSPVQAFTRNAYWFSIENFEILPDYFAAPLNERPLLSGKLSRGTNSAEFEARGITDFWLFLSDALLDLDKPIKVVVNGQAWNGTYKRELDKFLETRSRRGDPRMTYVAWHVSAVPKAANANSPPKIEPPVAPPERRER